MRVYIGADHNGYHLKAKLTSYLRDRGHEVVDEGDATLDPHDDFPIFAQRVANGVLSSGDPTARGILLCGSGQGMLIAANRFRGIRAGLGWSVDAARSIRNDEDSNVLALPAALFTTSNEWQAILDTWLTTPFANAARFKRRNAEIDHF